MEKKKDRLPQYIFLIWQDNIVQIICMLQKKERETKKCDIVQMKSHIMAVWGSLLECHTDGCHRGCTYPFCSFFLLPYCMQYCKLITLVCYVVCFLSLSFSHPTFQHLTFICSKRKKEKKKGKKKKKPMFCSFFHCQKLNGALYLDWKEFHMQSILKRKPALVNTFL